MDIKNNQTTIGFKGQLNIKKSDLRTIGIEEKQLGFVKNLFSLNTKNGEELVDSAVFSISEAKNKDGSIVANGKITLEQIKENIVFALHLSPDSKKSKYKLVQELASTFNSKIAEYKSIQQK